MKNFFSIVSILIRPEIQEKISVGVLLFDEKTVFFNSSKDKIEVIKQLVSHSSYKLIKDILKEINNKVNEQNKQVHYVEEHGLFKITSNPKIEFTPEYLNYLNVYSNNTIAFSAPVTINLPVNEESSNKLFAKYVNSSETAIANDKRVKPIETIKKQFGGKISRHFDIEKEISFSTVPNLITPVTVDFSGKNGIDVYVQTLDMYQHCNYISNDVNAFFQLKKAYEQAPKKKMKDYLVCEEPPKELVKQHEIWRHIRTAKIFDMIDLSESEKIIKYAEENNVVPLFSK